MSDEESPADKEHEPSQKRLDDARKRGQFPRSQDLATAAVYAGFLLALLVTGKSAVIGIGNLGSTLLGEADRIAPVILRGGAAPTSGLVLAMAWPLAGVFLFPAVAAILAFAVQGAWVVTPENLLPKLQRISVLSAAKQKFGIEGLVDFAKSLVKLLLVAGLLGWFFADRLGDIVGLLNLSPAIALAEIGKMTIAFLALVVIVSISIGVLDLLWQRARHQYRNRMSRKELMDESKDSDGDPHVKSQRRRRAQEIAMNQMLADVAKADVVIVNPTHYAVALKWDRAVGRAPVCVAKGVDEIAARIRERAAEAGVPLHRDAQTARALYATVNIGQQIRPEQYRAVAAAVRFSEAMRKRARRGLQ